MSKVWMLGLLALVVAAPVFSAEQKDADLEKVAKFATKISKIVENDENNYAFVADTFLLSFAPGFENLEKKFSDALGEASGITENEEGGEPATLTYPNSENLSQELRKVRDFIKPMLTNTKKRYYKVFSQVSSRIHQLLEESDEYELIHGVGWDPAEHYSYPYVGVINPYTGQALVIQTGESN